jgi:hypothetical protein
MAGACGRSFDVELLSAEVDAGCDELDDAISGDARASSDPVLDSER